MALTIKNFVIESLKTFYEKLSTRFQETLVSGVNLKTVSGETLLGSGNVVIDWKDLSGVPSVFPVETHNHDDRYLKLSGGTLDGGITFKYGSNKTDQFIQFSSTDSSDSQTVYLGIRRPISSYGLCYKDNNGNLYDIIHSGNYTTYTVKKDGTGATGTWGINITGNAATATALTTNAGSTNIPIYFTGGKPSVISITAGTMNIERPFVLVTDNNELYKTSGITANYSKNSITATTFKGNLEGNAKTATSLGSGALKYMCSLYTNNTYNAYKIVTDWHKSNNIMPTINIRGYAYGSAKTIDCDIVMYHYNNDACGYSLTNKGSYSIRVWQAIENDVQVFYINPGEYFGMFNVFVYGGMGTNAFSNWSMTTVDEVSGTEIESRSIATSITGNALTSSKWLTARTITLTGSVTGSVSIDGSANVSLATTTNHTHNYLPLSGGTMSNTNKVTNLNADLLDGYHASSFSLTSHTHSYIVTQGDNRSTATKPSDYINRITFAGLKNNSAVGKPSSTTYNYIVGLRGWSDTSGGKAHELAFNNNGIFHRIGDTDTWEAWAMMLNTSNYNSYAPKLDGTGAKGTWGINISGNAATATKLATSHTI